MLQSRIHKLKSFSNDKLTTYIKRDDELSCTISGSKLRKYHSLIPYLLSTECEEAVVIGGENSNHVLGLTQLLIENDIHPTLFLGESRSQKLSSNAQLLKCLVDDTQIHRIPKSEWNQVDKMAQLYCTTQKHKRTIVIPEGAFMPEALPGAMTLVEDILRNELESGLTFDHIFVDSGTGLTAISLIAGLVEKKHQAHVHIVLMADEESIFKQKLHSFYPDIKANYTVYSPDFCRSFGSVSTQSLKNIRNLAKTEGFFCDPIYNIKLFTKAKSLIESQNFKGSALIVHSGGTLSLLGFMDNA